MPKSPLVALGLGALVAVVAVAAKGRGAGNKSAPSTLMTFKGETVDTAVDNVRINSKPALEQWAKSQGYVQLGDAIWGRDPDFDAVLRSFVMNAERARIAAKADALFATMKGMVLFSVIVFAAPGGGRFSDLWGLPP